MVNFGYNININTNYVKISIIFIIIFLVVSIILFIILSFTILKFFKIAIDDNTVFFYKYNKKCQKMLDLYGDFEIKKMYLVREPIGYWITLILNILTFFNYNKMIKESQDNFPYHSSIIFELQMPNNKIKLVTLEKRNSINISEIFLINQNQQLKTINLKEKYTINSILKKTQKRIGNEKFFNWHVYKNNCQEFTKELLVSINKHNKQNKKFVLCSDKVIKFFIPSEFTVHFINCICVILNITEKYFLDTYLFN
uniref:Uncharacterized protein n=1 Tax=viral metagenome TaxID=1070528 RepID=A0A6C0KPW3_9ZZZZ